MPSQASTRTHRTRGLCGLLAMHSGSTCTRCGRSGAGNGRASGALAWGPVPVPPRTRYRYAYTQVRQGSQVTRHGRVLEQDRPKERYRLRLWALSSGAPRRGGVTGQSRPGGGKAADGWRSSGGGGGGDGSGREGTGRNMKVTRMDVELRGLDRFIETGAERWGPPGPRDLVGPAPRLVRPNIAHAPVARSGVYETRPVLAEMPRGVTRPPTSTGPLTRNSRPGMRPNDRSIGEFGLLREVRDMRSYRKVRPLRPHDQVHLSKGRCSWSSPASSSENCDRGGMHIQAHAVDVTRRAPSSASPTILMAACRW